MPFDPRLIHPDDAPLGADGDLDLPDDLSALAEQLSEDAAHLSARYPASREPQVAIAAELVVSAERIKRRAWRRSAFLVGAGLASVAAIGLTVAMFSQRSELSPRPEFVKSPSAASPREVLDAVPVSYPAPSSTALSLGELSGPEREALFDLLQRDSTRGSVSF
jgi:hypothetical protein